MDDTGSVHCAGGAPLPDDAPHWSCAADNATGLIWSLKTDDGGLHDRLHVYGWYQPDARLNGGVVRRVRDLR